MMGRLLGWQLYCHPRKMRAIQRRQYNCHPNTVENCSALPQSSPPLTVARKRNRVFLDRDAIPSPVGKDMMPATRQQIDDFGRRIGEEFHPRQVVLFGSHARDAATADSDVDVLVVMPFEGRSVDKSVEIRLKTNPPFPLDLLVRTPEVVQKRIEMGDCFFRDILQDGKVLYEAHDD
jgi:uncharacterized protein